MNQMFEFLHEKRYFVKMNTVIEEYIYGFN